MNAQLHTIPLPQTEPIQPQTEPIQPQFNIPRWNLALRIAFRLWMVYLGLYCLATQVLSVLLTMTTAQTASLPDLATLWPLRPVLPWTPAHILHVTAPLTLLWGANSGGSDCMYGSL